MFQLDRLDPRYRVILCDIWGVIHDGAELLPGAAARLRRWADEGRRVILLTNAPRPASTIEADLLRLGLTRGCWQAITSSGEAGIAALVEAGRPVGFLGTADDRADLERHGVEIAEDGYDAVAVTGLRAWDDRLDQYDGLIAEWRGRNVRLHCLNPDRLVIHRGVRMVCAGALADAYEAMGGEVSWYGKPHRPIYDHALRLGGDPPAGTVLAVGDGIATDMAGAAAMGIDALFVDSGLHSGETPPGSPGWRPIGIVRHL